MPQQSRPTWDDVKRWRAERIAALAAMHNGMLDADRWLHSDEKPSPIIQDINYGFPEDFRFDIINYAYIVGNRATNTVHTAEVPSVTYELPAYDKDNHKDWADDEKDCQTALQGIVHRIITRSTRSPALVQLQQQIQKGLGVITYARDYDATGDPPDHGRGTPEEIEAWEAYEHRASEALPWRVVAEHPNHILFALDSDPPQNYIIYKRVSRLDMARRFPKLGWDPKLESDNAQSSPCWYTEYVDPNYYGCWVDDRPVTENGDDSGIGDNALGHAWAQMAWSGLGDMDADGRWDRWGVGVVQRGIRLFESLTFNRNWLKLLKVTAIPKLIARGEESQGGRERAQEETQDLDPTKPQVATISSAVTLSWLDSPNLPAALMADIAKDEQELEAMFGPAVLSGANSEAGEPASKYAARTEAARGPYRSAKANIEQAWANMLADLLFDLKTEPDLQDGYSVAWSEGKGSDRKQYAVHLKPSQIHPGGKITVDFSPPTPQDRAFDTEDTTAKQKAGWYSVETSMKKGAQIDNTDEELSQIQADRVMADPNFVGWQAQKAIAALEATPQVQALMPPVPPQPPMGAPADTSGVPQPADPTLPPGVPQQPEPMLASPQAAQAEAQRFYPQSGFRPPPQRNGAGGY